MPRIPTITQQAQLAPISSSVGNVSVSSPNSALTAIRDAGFDFLVQHRKNQEVARKETIRADISASENVISQARMEAVNDWVGVDQERPDLSTLTGQAFIDTAHNVMVDQEKRFSGLMAGLNAEQRKLVEPVMKQIAFDFQTQVAARESVEMGAMEDLSLNSSIQSIQAKLGSYVGESVENGFLDYERVDQAVGDVVRRRTLYAYANQDRLPGGEDPADYVERTSREDASRIHSMNVALILAEGHPRAVELADRYVEDYDEDMLTPDRVVANERLAMYRSDQRVSGEVTRVLDQYVVVRGHTDEARDSIQSAYGSMTGTPQEMLRTSISAIRGNDKLTSAERSDAVSELKRRYAEDEALWAVRQEDLFIEMRDEMQAGGDFASIKSRYEFANVLSDDGRTALMEIDALRSGQMAERDRNGEFMRLSNLAGGVDIDNPWNSSTRTGTPPDVAMSKFSKMALVQYEHLFTPAQYKDLLAAQDGIKSNDLEVTSLKGEQNAIITRYMHSLGYGLTIGKQTAAAQSSKFFEAATRAIVERQKELRRGLTTIETESLMSDLSKSEFKTREGRLLEFDEPLLFADASDLTLEEDIPVAWLALPQMRGRPASEIAELYLKWKRTRLDDEQARLPIRSELYDDREPIPGGPSNLAPRPAPRGSFR